MSRAIVEAHQAAWRHIGVEVTYTERRVDHQRWLDELARTELPRHEAIGFVDIDCLAYSRAAVEEAAAFALDTKSFIGLAQSANHHRPNLAIYAAPSFLILSRAAHETLGRPRLKRGLRLDAAQNLSVVADAMGFAYRALYPFGYYQEPEGEIWRLGSYGYYGIGTEYAGGFFHLFQSRLTRQVELFRERANHILAGGAQPPAPPFTVATLATHREPSARSGPAIIRGIRYLLREL